MKVLLGAALALAVLVAGLLVYVFVGGYNVAATEPHTGVGEWLLETAMDRSIRTRAADLEVPEPDSAIMNEAFLHFHEMCVVCHGAPGIEPSEIGRGLMPNPPELSEEAEEWSPAELFWITKHGIKLAGMPAFGPTHSDEQLWGIVHIVRRLPETTPAEYREWVEALGADTTAGHTHAPGTPAHSH